MADQDNGTQHGAGDPGQPDTNPAPDNGAPQGGPKGQSDEVQKQKRESLEARIKDLEEQLKTSKDREASLNADLEKALSQDDVNAAVFWSSDKLTGNQTRSIACLQLLPFWSSDKLTGNQTYKLDNNSNNKFWSSDKLTGNQT